MTIQPSLRPWSLRFLSSLSWLALASSLGVGCAASDEDGEGEDNVDEVESDYRSGCGARGTITPDEHGSMCDVCGNLSSMRDAFYAPVNQTAPA